MSEGAGSPAEIKFDAIPDVKLMGKVSRIDDYGTNRQGDIVFAVVVIPDRLDERLKWNMTASVSIDADDCEIEQPCPWNATSATCPSSTCANTVISSPHNGLFREHVSSAAGMGRLFRGVL